MFERMAKAMAIGFIALLIISGVAVSRYDGTASASPVLSASDLSRKDVFGSARLSVGERSNGVEICHRRLTELSFAFARVKRTKNESEIDKARRFCDCFANQVEDRSSRMQYAMAMTVLAKGYAIASPRSFPAFNEYKTAAGKHGMSADEFETMRRELGRSLTQSAEQCAMNMTE